MLSSLTLRQAHEGLIQKKFSSLELIKDVFDRIERLNPLLNAYIAICKDFAFSQAGQADMKFQNNEMVNVLCGIPAGLKDIFNTRGIATTCGSSFLKNFISPYNATVVDKLYQYGMVLTGKLNMDEFACGSSTEHSCFGVTKNPWDFNRVAGGSSGGSAAAVAADMAFYTLGTDTGGSIRQPASLCGVVGLKVTYGRVSRSGVTAMASSWDTIGSFTKTVEDAAYVLQAIAGQDEKDSTTSPLQVPDYTLNLGKSIHGLKIGIPKEYFGEGIEPEVRKCIQEALRQYEQLGATLHEVSLPSTKYALAVYYITQPAELSANLARFDGIRYGAKPRAKTSSMTDYYYQARSEGFGDEIKRRIMIGTYVLSAGYYDAYYRKAQKVRTLIIQDFEEVFQKVDILVAPVSPFPAFVIGEKNADPLAMYQADVFTIPSSCAGIPALSIPCGFTSNNLPVGMQIIGSQWSEDLLLKAGAAYEQLTEWHKQKPSL